MKNYFRLMTLGLLFCFSAKAQSSGNLLGVAYYSNANTNTATSSQDNGSITGFAFKPLNNNNYYQNFTIRTTSQTQFLTNLVVRHIKIDSLNIDTTVVNTGREYQLEYNTVGTEKALSAYCLLNIQDNIPLYLASGSYISVWGGEVDLVNKVITNPEKIYIFLNYYKLNQQIISCWK